MAGRRYHPSSRWSLAAVSCVALCGSAATIPRASAFSPPPTSSPFGVSRGCFETPIRHRRPGSSLAAGDSDAASGASEFVAVARGAEREEVLVALTREDGKNTKLLRALLSHPRIGDAVPVDIEEVPCIEHADGDDFEKLAPLLREESFDYVAVTSPEAAKVMASAWESADRPQLGKVAAVGKATGEALVRLGIEVDFVPTKATAKTLVQELPESEGAVKEGRPTTLLYPASAKAKPTLQEGLEGRGFAVTRLDTYDTVPARWSASQIDKARGAGVACFASPSAVNAWVENLGGDECRRDVAAACIGETSAQGCRDMGWDEGRIYYPEKPGVEGWANAVADALESIAKAEY